MNKPRLRVLEDMLIHKEKIKSENSSLRVENTSEGLSASISRIESNKLEQITSSQGKNIIPTAKSFWESGHYGTNGIKATYSTRMRLIDFKECEPSTEYFTLNQTYILRGYDKNKNYVQNVGVIKDGNSFTTDENVVYLGVSVDKIYDEYDEETDQFMICKNSEVDKTWAKGTVNIPSTNYSSDIEGVTGDVKLKVQNKNYLLLKNSTTKAKGITTTVSNQLIEAKGTLDADYNYFELMGRFPVDLKTGIYTFSTERILKESLRLRLFFEDGTHVDVIIPTNEKSKTALVERNVKFCYIYAVTDKGATIDFSTRVQLEKESTATNYAEHKEKEFAISLGNKTLYKGDKIIRQDGKWYFSRVWKYFNDFSKAVKEPTNTVGKSRIKITLDDNFKITDKNTNRNAGYCNKLKLVNNGVTFTLERGFTVGFSIRKYIFAYVEEFAEIENNQELQQKLTELGFYFVLPLEEAELEEITDEQLTKQLKAIYLHVREYDEITNFDFDNDVTFEIAVEKNKISILESRLDNAEKQNTVVEEVENEQEVTVENEVSEETVDTVQALEESAE